MPRYITFFFLLTHFISELKLRSFCATEIVRFVGSHGSTLCTTKLNANAVADANSVMRTVFENGCIIVDDTFDAIRNRTR
jgi:hypothetical protein